MARLPDAERRAERGAFFGSIHRSGTRCWRRAGPGPRDLIDLVARQREVDPLPPPLHLIFFLDEIGLTGPEGSLIAENAATRRRTGRILAVNPVRRRARPCPPIP